MDVTESVTIAQPGDCRAIMTPIIAINPCIANEQCQQLTSTDLK